MEENNKKKPNYLLAGFIVIELIFFIIIGIVFMNLSSNDDITFNSDESPSIARIEGLPASFSEDESNMIGSTLYALMLENTTDKYLSNSNTLAKVKDDSETTFHFDEQGLTLYSADISVPDLEQSYRLYYAFPDKDKDSFQPFISLFCETAPVSPCTSSSNTDELGIVRDFLPYFEFDRFTAYISEEEPTVIKISPIKIFDGDKNVEMSHIDEVKTAISKMGFSPDLFTYRVLSPEDFNYEIDI